MREAINGQETLGLGMPAPQRPHRGVSADLPFGGSGGANLCAGRALAMSKTLFEKIIAREIPASVVYEDDTVLAFKDINPGAPTHVLIVPKKPIPRIAEAGAED